MSKFPDYIQAAYPFLDGAGDLAQMFVANDAVTTLVPYGTANYGKPTTLITVQPGNFVTPTADFQSKAGNVGTMVVTRNGLRQSKYFTAPGPTTNIVIPPQSPSGSPICGFEVDVQPGAAGTSAATNPTVFGLLTSTSTPYAMFSRPTVLDSSAGSDGLGWCWDVLVPQAASTGAGAGVPYIYDVQFIPDTPPAPGDSVSITLWLHRTATGIWEPHTTPYIIPPYSTAFPQLQTFVGEFVDGATGGPYGGAVNGMAISIATSSNYGPVPALGKCAIQIWEAAAAVTGTTHVQLPPYPQRLVGFDVQDFQKMVRLGVERAVETAQTILVTVTTAEAALAGQVVAGDLDSVPEISSADLLGTLMAVPRNMVSRSFKKGVHSWRMPSNISDFEYGPITACKRGFFSIVYAEAPTSSFGNAAAMVTVNSTVQMLTNNPLLATSTFVHPNLHVLEGVLTLLRALPRATENDEHVGFGAAVKKWGSNWRTWYDMGRHVCQSIMPYLPPEISAFARSAGAVVSDLSDDFSGMSMTGSSSRSRKRASASPLVMSSAPPTLARGRSQRSRSASRSKAPRKTRGRSRSRQPRSRSRSRGRVRIAAPSA